MKYIIRISDDLSETQRMSAWKKSKTARLTGANNRDSANISIFKKNYINIIGHIFYSISFST